MDDRVSLVLADGGRTAGPAHRTLWELATRLPRSRFQPRVWLSAAPGMDDLAAALESCELPVERLHDAESPLGPLGWRSRFDIGRRFLAARPALFHLHLPDAGADRMAGLMVDAAGTARVVLSLATVSDPATSRLALRRVVPRLDAATVPSRGLAERLVQEFTLEPERVRSVPPGVDLPDHAAEKAAAHQWRERLGAMPVRPLWVCAGRLDRDRGHDTLLDALADVHRRGIPFTCACAGEGLLRDSLERRARDLDLAHCLHFTGEVEDLGPLLAAADLVIVPSAGETVPGVLLEALARARPIIAAAIGGVRDVMEDGVHGRLFPPADARLLADAIENAYRRPEAARRLGAQGAQRVQDEFAWPRVVARFEEIYDEALGLATFEPERVVRQSR